MEVIPIRPNDDQLLVAAAAGTATTRARFRSVFRGERTAAAAGADRVGIVDLEATAHDILDVIDRSAVDIVDTLRIHNYSDATAVEDEIALFHAVIDGHAVVQARATPTRDKDAQSGIRLALPF